MKVEHRQIVERVRPARRVPALHASVRSCARGLLESDGYDVVGAAADGGSAVDLAAELDRELVLLDIQLADIEEPQLQIVLLSSRERSSREPLIEQSGAPGILADADLDDDALARSLE
jgi:DNA-binding NarL/FixJ family response regulator